MFCFIFTPILKTTLIPAKYATMPLFSFSQVHSKNKIKFNVKRYEKFNVIVKILIKCVCFSLNSINSCLKL